MLFPPDVSVEDSEPGFGLVGRAGGADGEGTAEGSMDGAADGSCVGDGEGSAVGPAVGVGVGTGCGVTDLLRTKTLVPAVSPVSMGEI